MIREAIAKGDTVEQAFTSACQELGVDTTEAEFEILEMPQKKTFGLFGGAPARVRAYIEVPDPEPEAAAPVAAAPVAANGKGPAEQAADYLKSVLGAMGLQDVEVEIRPVEAGAELVLSGDDIGFIIGHRGETLDALQYLGSLVANHVDGSYFRITLDVGNYREKRKETLENLGRKMAARAVKTGRNTSLEPMNPYERRIIHTAVQTVEGAKSWSEGEDLARHVVIGPEGGERLPKRDNRRGKGGKGGYNRGGKSSRRENRPSRPAQQTQPAAPRVLDDVTTLYGKIEKK